MIISKNDGWKVNAEIYVIRSTLSNDNCYPGHGANFAVMETGGRETVRISVVNWKNTFDSISMAAIAPGRGFSQ